MDNKRIIDLKNLQPKKRDESSEVEGYLAEMERLRSERQEKMRAENEVTAQTKEENKTIGNSAFTEKNTFYETVTYKRNNFWQKSGRSILYLLIFLLPLFFLPTTVYPVDANKQTLAAFLILASLLCYLANSYFSRRIVYPSSILIIAVIFFVAAGGISAFFSISPNTSFYGDFNQADVLINFITYGLALYLSAVFFKKGDFNRIGVVFLASMILVSLLGLMQLFGFYIFPFDFTKQVGFNVFGSVINFDIFMAFGLVLIVSVLSELDNSLKAKFILIFSGLLITLNLILINYQPIWTLLAIMMIIYAVYKFVFKAEGNSSSLIGSSAPLFVGIISFLFAMVGPSLPKIISMPNIPIDVKPNFSVTMDISKNALGGYRIFTGTGLATFSSQYDAYRPVELNQSNFWRIKFNQGFSFAGTYAVTAGVVGILSILVVIFAFARTALRNLEDKNAKVVSIGALFMILGWFCFPASFVGLVFSFIAFGMLVAFDSDLKVLDFSRAAKIRAAAGLMLIIIFAFGATSMIYFYVQKYAASFYFQGGLQEYSSGNTVKSVEDVTRAISLDQNNDQYLRSASQLLIIDAQNSRDTKLELNKDTKFQAKIADSVQFAKRATEINPAYSENWYNLGDVYEKIINIAGGADSFAESSYRKASELNPKNPDPLIGQAKVLMYEAKQSKDSNTSKEKIVAAIQVLENAVKLKSDYAASHFQLGLAYAQAERKDDAIKEFEVSKILSDSDAPVDFQLGMLYYNNNDLDKAKVEMEAAISLDPNFSNARYVLGLIYDKKSDKNNAIKQFEAVLKLNPNNTEVKDILNNLKTKGSAFATDKPVAPETINQSSSLPESAQKEIIDGVSHGPAGENPAVPSSQLPNE